MKRQMKIMRNKVEQPLDRRLCPVWKEKADEPPINGCRIAMEKELYLSMRLITSL
jgi:hypothetical protein